jgi:predicted transcriptional regulator
MKPTVIRLPEALHERLQVRAELRAAAMAQCIRDAIVEWLDRRESKTRPD